MRKEFRAQLALGLLSLGFAGIATAQVDPNAQTLTRFSGQMHAVAQACGDYTPAQLNDMKTQQQQAMVASGMSAADFESTFNEAVTATTQKIAGGTAEQRAQMCAQMKADGKR